MQVTLAGAPGAGGMCTAQPGEVNVQLGDPPTGWSARITWWSTQIPPTDRGDLLIGLERDRREATVAGAIVLYYVSGTVLTVTVVRLVPLP